MCHDKEGYQGRVATPIELLYPGGGELPPSQLNLRIIA